MSQNGKGSNPRPFSVDSVTYKANWERIFKGEIKDDACAPCEYSGLPSTQSYDDTTDGTTDRND